MNDPTEADIGKPVIHKKSRRVRQIKQRSDGRFGVWDKYRGWHAAKWANWEMLNGRLPIDEDPAGPSTPPGGAGGMA